MKNPERAIISILAGLVTTLAFLLLVGCSSGKVVSIPTPVACVKPADIPAAPDPVASKLTGNAREDVAILAVAVLELRDYGGKLRALLRGCE